MIDIEFSIDDAEFRREIRALEVDAAKKLALVAEAVGRETIAYLRSYTGETRPALRPGQPNRRAHPGGWADVTQNLSNAYGFEVSETDGAVTLTLLNTMEYAAALEARDGYFVLRGVTDPGGPVEKALREVIPRIAPGWTVMVG